MHYRIIPPPHAGAAKSLRQALDWLAEDKGMQVDRGRLSLACRAPAKFLGLQGAPLPPPGGFSVLREAR